MTRETSGELPLSDFVIPSSFDVLLPRRRSATKARILSFGNRAAFTIIELLVVIAIIITLAGLILSTVGYVQKKGARSRAETEIAAMSAALESYRADNGIYPRDAATTDALDAKTAVDSTAANYKAASKFLYGELTGDRDFDGSADAGSKSYMSFKPASMGRNDMSNPPGAGNTVTMLRDPFGNSYGYSTAYQNNPATGYNPTFDLWSTAGGTSATGVPQWIKNW